MLGFFCVINS